MSDTEEIKLDETRVTALAEKIAGLMPRKSAGHFSEGLMALMRVLAREVAAIDCPQCRKLAAEQVKQRMPEHLRQGLDFAAQLDAAGRPTSHMH